VIGEFFGNLNSNPWRAGAHTQIQLPAFHRQISVVGSAPISNHHSVFRACCCGLRYAL